MIYLRSVIFYAVILLNACKYQYVCVHSFSHSCRLVYLNIYKIPLTSLSGLFYYEYNMVKTYNLYNLEAPFKEYLDAGNQKAISIKNYLSDVRHFFGWLILYFRSHKIQIESEATITQFITGKVISEYRSYLSENNIPHKTINRRLSTIRKFCSFCISQGWMKENPAKQIANISIKTVFDQRQSLLKC